jgi:hypothetical protein
VRAALAGRLDRARESCLFDRIDWLETLHDQCLSDKPVRVFHVQEGDADVWLFLMAREARHLSALANWYSFSWNPIFGGAPDEAMRRRLLESIAKVIVKDVAQVDLYPVTTDDGMAATLIAAFRRAGWFAVQRPMGGNHVLHLHGRDFATYWAQRPSRLRNQVKRKAKLSRFDLSITTHMTEQDWTDYVAIHGNSWKKPETGIDFFREMATREGFAGTLRLGFARLNGRPVATQLWTIENGVALIHKLAHDRAFDEGSPGTLLSHAMFRQAIDGDRVAMIDYGTGDNPYKTEWMDRRQALYRIDCFNPRFASSWIPAARTAISALVG